MTLDLSATQRANALGIIAAAKALTTLSDADRKQVATIAVCTALTESGMRMIASANVPESQKYPHELLPWSADGLGHDHASCGMFQQQTGTAWTPAGYGSAMNQTTMNSPNGWGTPAELMDAKTSTGKFLAALLDVGWKGKTGWQAAQDVQHSAFPDGSNYQQQWARAVAVVNELWAGEAPLGSGIELEEDEMKPYLVRDGSGNYWVIRFDFSSKTQVTPKVAVALDNTHNYLKNPGLDQTTLGRIPVAK